MKMTKEQLRRIIHEAVKAKLAESPMEGPSGSDFIEVVAVAMSTQMIDLIDANFSSNVHKMIVEMYGTNFMRPDHKVGDTVVSNYVEHFAAKAVDAALADPDLKDALLMAAIKVLHNIMEPD